MNRLVEVAAMRYWDSVNGQHITTPTKRITKGFGSKIFEPIEGTRELVDASCIDGQGRYVPRHN